MIQRWKLSQLDGMECTSSENLTHHFPFHFHYEYSIGISLKGLQRLELQEGAFLVPPGTLMLINPRQMHAHYSLNDLGWSYKMLYLNTDIVRYLTKMGWLGTEDQWFGQTLITDPPAHSRWKAFFDQSGDTDESHDPDGTFLFTLISDAFRKSGPRTEQAYRSMQTADIQQYLEIHFNEKLDLTTLAKKFRVDKFQLIRQFKRHAGVTPQVFLTIVRVEKARKYLDDQYPLVEAALEAGFYDQSHFHRYFQHFTSFTPGQYKARLLAAHS
jgi:AraC-like DNA-binding protein